MDSDTILQPQCNVCTTQLIEPYIQCAECDDVNLCTNCFSKGAEIASHENTHKYAVRKNNFNLFESCHWTAKDEYLLLKYISEHGYGNWEEISKSMQNYSPLECQEHYKKFFIDDTQHESLKNLLNKNDFSWSKIELPFLLKESNSDDPFRQTKSQASQHLAGYNPYRSDFEINFDNNAENILNFPVDENENQDEDDELLESLQCSMVMAYNNRLRERQRRYNIMRCHGLILVRKFNIWLQRFEETLNHQTVERMVAFMQLMSATQFDYFFERILIEKELFLYLMHLHDLRKNGIRTFKGCSLYQSLKEKERDQYRHLREFMASAELDWKYLTPNESWNLSNPVTNSKTIPWKTSFPKDVKLNTSRKISPLEIVGLPGYDRLSDKERDLCSLVRLVPVNFIEFRDLLISENNKNGCLRLLDARRLIKIDVNKTRKLYDYLVSEGFISKPQQ